MVNAGKLVLANTSSLGNLPAALTVNGGTPDLDDHSFSVTALSGTDGSITNSVAGSYMLTLLPSGTTTYSGSILEGCGTLSLLKQGNGTLTLSGANNFSDGVVIEAARLVVGSATALGSAFAALTVDGGTLDLGNQGSHRAAKRAETKNSDRWQLTLSFLQRRDRHSN